MTARSASTLVAVNVVVHNGVKTIIPCLSAVRCQSFRSLDINVLDNASDDGTADVVRKHFPDIRLIRNSVNVGMWLGQEQLLKFSSAPYVLALSCDVILEGEFVEAGVALLNTDDRIGAVQCKMVRHPLGQAEGPRIDSCGFRIFRSRRVVNIGQGQIDRGQYDFTAEVFAVEGAAPLFRRNALDSATVSGELADPLFFWYGDDLDIGWRLHLLGWKQMYHSRMVAWHERLTSNSVSKHAIDSIRRRHLRRQVPLRRRQLEWCNVRLARVKNEQVENVAVHLRQIVGREIGVFIYSIAFEPGVLLAIPRFAKRLPAVLRKRWAIQAAGVVPASEIRGWFDRDFR